MMGMMWYVFGFPVYCTLLTMILFGQVSDVPDAGPDSSPTLVDGPTTVAVEPPENTVNMSLPQPSPQRTQAYPVIQKPYNPVETIGATAKTQFPVTNGVKLESNSRQTEPHCELCGRNGPDREYWYCHQCMTTFCDVDWEVQWLHDDSRLKPGQLPHERVNKRLELLIRSCVRPDWQKEDLRKVHEEDFRTTWFGVDEESTQGGETLKTLRNYERFEQLMFEWEPYRRLSLYPSIVSFVGESG
jgi:hypothetical protein